MQVTQKNGSKVFFHILWNISKCKGSCNVCGAFQIPTAGVCKEETISRDWYIAIFGCAVVNNCCVVGRSTDWLEALPEISVLFFPKFFQLVGCTKFRDRRFRRVTNVCLQPMHKTSHSNPIFDVSLFDIVKFCFIFYRFHQYGRIFAFDNRDSFWNAVTKRIVNTRRV